MGGQTVAVRQAGHLSYLAGDHLGSTSVVTQGEAGPGQGQVLAQTRYSPFGEERWSEGELPTDKTFTGQRNEDFGLMDFGARQYDPQLGRFVSPDALIPEPGNPLAWDRYAYVNNNPISNIDPSGHFTIPFQCPSGYCNSTWLDFSGVDKRLEGMAEVLGTFGCLLLGCHVDPLNNTITGPTTKEYADMMSNSLPGPAMLTFPPVSAASAALTGAGLETSGSANIIKQIAAASTRGELSPGGVTILGSFDEYINMGKLEGMTYFDMDPLVWETLKNAGDDYVWAVNKQFLDDSIAAGHSFVVTLGEGKPIGKWLGREIQYLEEQGYRLVDGVFIKEP